MDPTKLTNTSLKEAKYIEFPCLADDAKHPDGSLALNRYSNHITRGHDFPGAKVCPITTVQWLLFNCIEADWHG